MSMNTPNGKIILDKPIKNFNDIEEIKNEQHFIVTDENNIGYKVKSENVKKDALSKDEDNIVVVSEEDNSFFIDDKVGNLEELTTRANKDSVSAINEIVSKHNKVGELPEGKSVVDLINDSFDDYTEEIENRETTDEDIRNQILNLRPSVEQDIIVGSYAEMIAYDVSKLEAEDIVKVLKDETKADAITYYRYTPPTFEYLGFEEASYSEAEYGERFVPATNTIQNKPLSNTININLHELSGTSIFNPQINETLKFKDGYWTNDVVDEVKATWGLINGNINNQADIVNALNTKVDNDRLSHSEAVIETYENCTSGYRIWSDGYCFQWGGIYAQAATTVVYFLKQFKDTSYSPYCNINFSDTTAYGQTYNLATTNMTVKTSSGKLFRWCVCGYLADGEY